MTESGFSAYKAPSIVCQPKPEKFSAAVEDTFPSCCHCEAEVEDLLALFYEEMKQRGLIYKLHIGNLMPPNTKEKVYDYLYVGEGTRNVKEIIEGCKDIAPYLVPAFDRRVAKISDPDMVYAYTIPFVQFPLLQPWYLVL